MAVNHFAADAVHHILQIKEALFLRDLTVKHYLHQHIPQLLLKVFTVPGLA